MYLHHAASDILVKGNHKPIAAGLCHNLEPSGTSYLKNCNIQRNMNTINPWKVMCKEKKYCLACNKYSLHSR